MSICIVGGGVQTGSTRHVGHLLAYCTCPGWSWGWRIWWNKWQGRKPTPTPLCAPQIPLDQTRDWTQAAAVGSQRLTASATARPCYEYTAVWDVVPYSPVDRYQRPLRICCLHFQGRRWIWWRCKQRVSSKLRKRSTSYNASETHDVQRVGPARGFPQPLHATHSVLKKPYGTQRKIFNPVPL
jgi:hypothetical protein